MSEDTAFAVEKSFLAREFLTWLWFRCEAEGGEFTTDMGEFALVVEDALALASWDDDGLKVSVRGGMPTTSAGAAGSLGAGLQLRKARFLLARDDREWSFNLDSDHLDVSGMKSPATEEDEDDDPLVTKLAAGEELRDLVESLYGQFVELRLGDTWESLEPPCARSVPLSVRITRKRLNLGIWLIWVPLACCRETWRPVSIAIISLKSVVQ